MVVFRVHGFLNTFLQVPFRKRLLPQLYKGIFDVVVLFIRLLLSRAFLVGLDETLFIQIEELRLVAVFVFYVSKRLEHVFMCFINLIGGKK